MFCQVPDSWRVESCAGVSNPKMFQRCAIRLFSSAGYKASGACIRKSIASGSSTSGALQSTRACLTKRYFSSSDSDKKDDKVPEDFFDKEVENDKEFLDSMTSLNEGGLENLSMTKTSVTWDEVEEAINSPFNVSEMFDFDGSDMDASEMDDNEFSPNASAAMAMAHDSIISHDVADHIEGFKTHYVPPEFLNFNLPYKKTDIADKTKRRHDDPETVSDLIEKFIPSTAPEKFTHDKQGLKHCPGKRQKRGKIEKAKLQCHLIDLEELNYLDVVGLRKFLSDDSEILGRKHTGLCAKCQRKVAKSIKRSRNFGLLPHLGEFVLQDSRPMHQGENVHESLLEDGMLIKSKSIL